ncbi:hypothetical protein NKI04_34945 [Mesorhizobium sp. M0814]|uniref:hypothetical protein n=1 Tax=Mesorhizobium sp. M0814 TaxID=2957004 RepID=UPI0033393FEC
MRKSTGFVATMILTALVGPITTALSARGSSGHGLRISTTANAHGDAVDLKLDPPASRAAFRFRWFGGRLATGSGAVTTAGTKAGESRCTEAAGLRASRRQAKTCCGL